MGRGILPFAFNSQMKAMLGTILSIVGLCTIPAILIVLLGAVADFGGVSYAASQ